MGVRDVPLAFVVMVAVLVCARANAKGIRRGGGDDDNSLVLSPTVVDADHTRFAHQHSGGAPMVVASSSTALTDLDGQASPCDGDGGGNDASLSSSVPCDHHIRRVQDLLASVRTVLQSTQSGVGDEHPGNHDAASRSKSSPTPGSTAHVVIAEPPMDAVPVAVVLPKVAVNCSQYHKRRQQQQQHGGGSGDSSKAGGDRTVVVVRTHGVVGVALFRYYALALPHVHVWCVYDGTRGRSARTVAALRQLAAERSNFDVLETSDELIRAKFPRVRWPWRADFYPGRLYVPPIGYYIHSPSLVLLINHLENEQQRQQQLLQHHQPQGLHICLLYTSPSPRDRG